MHDHRRTLDARARPSVHFDSAEVCGLVGDRLASCGKSAIAIARQFAGRERNFTGEHFWARGYCVSMVGYEEEKVRAYIREQEDNDDEGRF